MAGVAEKRVALVAKEDTQKLGYEDMKACQLEIIAGLVSGRDAFVTWWALNKHAVELAIA